MIADDFSHFKDEVSVTADELLVFKRAFDILAEIEAEVVEGDPPLIPADLPMIISAGKRILDTKKV